MSNKLKVIGNWIKDNGKIAFLQFLMLSLNIVELILVFVPSKKVSLRKTLSKIAEKIKDIQVTSYRY